MNIAKGNQFCNCMYIESGSKPIFDKLKKDHYLIGISSDNICDALAYYLGEINVIHPFREGNGRTQRVFIESLAQVAGYQVDFANVSGVEMIEASAFAFDCDYRKMENIFESITTVIPAEEQEKYIAKVTQSGSDFIDLFHFQTASAPEQEEEPELSLE